MKKLAAIVAVAALFTGCQALTNSKITTYGADGKIVSVAETNESIAATITKSAANKTVVVCETGWGVKMEVGAQLQSGMTPELTLQAGKIEAFYGSLLKNVTGEEISKIIQAAHNELTIGPGGVSDKKEVK
jgi:hypothetical protein